MKRPDRQKDRQIEKDIPHGRSSARLAPGGKLFDASDDSHVSRVTPLQTKRRELENDPRYRTEAAPDTNKTREQRTTQLRRDKDTRPV